MKKIKNLGTGETRIIILTINELLDKLAEQGIIELED